MEQFMKENGLMTNRMEKVWKNGFFIFRKA